MTEIPIVLPKNEDSATLIEQYEQLRRSAIQSYGELSTNGYGVFVLRGMVGWIKALPTIEPISEDGSIPYDIGVHVKPPSIPSENYPDVVHILSNMVISCLGGCF